MTDGVLGAVLDRRYRVDAVLARGGMSTVYRGVDTRLDRPVAIKVMDPWFAGDPSFAERFEREARAAARLHHPAVVGVHDQGVDRSPSGDWVFLVMELVEGGTLRDLLRARGALPVPLALSVVEPVLSALGAAHRAGLVHRDVKPENVLIGPGGTVKVADFGLVRAAAEVGTSTGNVILGTVAYLSPEQVATGAADPRSDVYAAGVLLYEMLTGAPPYSGDTALAVAYRHVNDQVPPPSATAPGLPSAVDELVLHTTRRDPLARPADAAAFLLGAQRVRGALGIRRVPVPVPPLPDPPPTRPVPEPALAATGPARSATSATLAAPAPPATAAADRLGPRGTRALERAPSPVSTRPAVLEERYRRDRARSRRTFLAWTVAVLLLAALVFGGAWWLAAQTVAVPALTGLDRAAAEQVLTAAELVPSVTEDHHDRVPAGRVVSTDPGPGSRVDSGSPVAVLVSLGHPVVPELPPGVSFTAAERILADADLRAVRDEEASEYSDTVPKGAVIGPRPAAGTELTVGAPVTLVVSRGPAPVAVPDVRGRPAAEATAALKAAGLVVAAEPRQVFDRKVPAGHVVAVHPGPGTTVRRGSPVRLVVSTAVTVPELRGTLIGEAEAMLREIGLNPSAQQIFGGSGSRVLAQFPAAGSLVRPGDTVRLLAG